MMRTPSALPSHAGQRTVPDEMVGLAPNPRANHISIAKPWCRSNINESRRTNFWGGMSMPSYLTIQPDGAMKAYIDAEECV